MAKFGIYSASGVLKGVGYPTYTGTYMKPGVLDFREVASPTHIKWAIGDYVGYESGGNIVQTYPRTGLKYTLYSIPQVKRQATNKMYGGALIYQNVQFYDASYLLTIIPFRDLVAGDNRVHFSTQPSIAVFTNVAGIAERLQACLDVDYANQWYIRLATTAMGASQDVVDLMAEYRDFAVSGVTLQGVLDKVYEVWPEIGWTFSYEQVTINNTLAWRNVITIGGAGLNLSSAPTYLYGRGHGLTGLVRTVANADEIANRIYAYGSQKNMLSGWYRSQQIKDSDSVDIQHLMLPIDAVGTPGTENYYPGWGKTDNLPDAAKAYVENQDYIQYRGLREKIIYFDGTGDMEEIYPTIRNMTIKDVRDALGSSSAPHYPDTTIYPDQAVRVDKVLSVSTVFDSGLASSLGKSSTKVYNQTISYTQTGTITAGDYYKMFPLIYNGSLTSTVTGTKTALSQLSLSGTVTIPGATRATLVLTIKQSAVQGGSTIAHEEVELESSTSSQNTFILAGFDSQMDSVAVNANSYTVNLELRVWFAVSSSSISYSVSATGSLDTFLSNYRAKTFQIEIRQIGFDISEQAAIGEGKTIHFRTGKCAGRTFSIMGCTYRASTDSWLLEVIRSEDESLSQWFPNTDYPVRGVESSPAYDGDEFVLLDIAMPDTYIVAAEKRLLSAAQDYLDWSKKEVWQYSPEIDAKFMLENNRTIKPADYMILYDSSIVNEGDLATRSYFKEHTGVYYLTKTGQKILLSKGGDSEAVLVDSVTISEGESTIPTYKVTLRERKRIKESNAAEVQGVSSKPVTSVKEERASTANSKSQFFEDDGEGGVKLKDEYSGLWTRGFVTAGSPGASSAMLNSLLQRIAALEAAILNNS